MSQRVNFHLTANPRVLCCLLKRLRLRERSNVIDEHVTKPLVFSRAFCNIPLHHIGNDTNGFGLIKHEGILAGGETTLVSFIMECLKGNNDIFMD